MDRQIVTTTKLQGLRPLGVGGRSAHDSWEQIYLYLESAVSPQAAAFFSEPIIHGDSVTWYTVATGAPQSFESLEETEQDSLLRKATDYIGQIRAVADSLKQSTNDAEQRMGAMLDIALTTPQSESQGELLYSVSGEPVLISWGIRLDIPNAQPVPLQDVFAKRSPRSAQPAVQQPLQREIVYVERRVGFLSPLLWLLFLLLLMAIYYWLFIGCGLFGVKNPFIDYCPAAYAQTIEEEFAMESKRGDELQKELNVLRERFFRAGPCEEVAIEDEEDDPFQDRLDRAGGEADDIMISLIWDDSADLDLSVTCPRGQRIDYNNRSACGGVLNIDQNRRKGRGASVVPDPVENVNFSDDTISSGRYEVYVTHFRYRENVFNTNRSIPFKVRVQRNENVEIFEGSVALGQTVLVTSFDVP